MTKKKYKTAKEKGGTLGEPIVAYSNTGEKAGGSITISTLNEQEESNYIYWLSLTPEERWAEHYKLLQRMYGKKNDNRISDYKIIFD